MGDHLSFGVDDDGVAVIAERDRLLQRDKIAGGDDAKAETTGGKLLDEVEHRQARRVVIQLADRDLRHGRWQPGAGGPRAVPETDRRSARSPVLAVERLDRSVRRDDADVNHLQRHQQVGQAGDRMAQCAAFEGQPENRLDVLDVARHR